LPVGRQHEEEKPVVERLHQVVGSTYHAPATTLRERLAQLRKEGEQETQDQEVAHDPADVRQAAPEHEERHEAETERARRDSPPLAPAKQAGLREPAASQEESAQASGTTAGACRASQSNKKSTMGNTV